jgi:putative oxidoreductase
MTKQTIHPAHDFALQLLFPAARAMLTATFIIIGLRQLMHWSGALDEMVGDGMPRSSVLLLGSIAFRLFGGFLVLVGLRAKYGAALLVAFFLPAAFLAHNFWAMPAARQTHESIEFLNNLAIAAGALLVALNGAGPFSIDSGPSMQSGWSITSENS